MSVRDDLRALACALDPLIDGHEHTLDEAGRPIVVIRSPRGDIAAILPEKDPWPDPGSPPEDCL